MGHKTLQFSLSVVSDSLQPHESHHARPPGLSSTPGVHSNSRPSSHLILCRPLLLLPPIPPSIKVFSNESTLRMRWPQYWSFSFSISPSKEHPGLISFRMDWLDLLAVQQNPYLWANRKKRSGPVPRAISIRQQRAQVCVCVSRSLFMLTECCLLYADHRENLTHTGSSPGRIPSGDQPWLPGGPRCGKDRPLPT